MNDHFIVNGTMCMAMCEIRVEILMRFFYFSFSPFSLFLFLSSLCIVVLVQIKQAMQYWNWCNSVIGSLREARYMKKKGWIVQWIVNMSLSRQPILEYGTILSMTFSCQTVFSSLHCGIRRLERRDYIVSIKEKHVLDHHFAHKVNISHWTTLYCKDLSNTISMWSHFHSAYFGSNQYFLYA